MIIYCFYLLNILFLLSGLMGFRQVSGERNFSIALVQNVLFLPLLAGEYLYLSYHWQFQTVQLIQFSEIVFALVWLSLALRMRQATRRFAHDLRQHFFVEIIFGGIVLSLVYCFLVPQSVVVLFENKLSFRLYGFVYFATSFLLLVVMYSAWRLEQFWRYLGQTRRWEYKFLVVGCYLICGTLAWSCSYRLTYLTIYPTHLQLMSLLLFLGWGMMVYAVVHHRLLNRKIFVSRKVVYSFVLPSLLASYLFSFGLVSLIMRTFGVEMSFVLKWLVLVLGLVGIGLFAFSGKIRRRVHFFISTHFYVNKYEYRDEWLALSERLKGALGEREVINGLRDVLAESLYTTRIYIWLEDTNSSQGYKLVSGGETSASEKLSATLGPDDPIVHYFQDHSYFYKAEQQKTAPWQEVMDRKEDFLSSLSITLLTPIAIGEQLIGLIALGAEYTGGEYGYDDFDLLTALGTQTASALLAARMAEELAYAREQQAWNRLSAFVLHDIKNAATMLSLLQENAPEHIHEAEFQQDMLELVDDALKRMGRVEQRLTALKDDIELDLQKVLIGNFVKECCQRLASKMQSIKVRVECVQEVEIFSDQGLLSSILENILLNAAQACHSQGVVDVDISVDSEKNQVIIALSDNGPGIEEDFLPELLFEPFRSAKKGGSGIGLWQVKKMVNSLGGSISAGNNQNGGASFTLTLPLKVADLSGQ